jgi:hypothetical protein
MYTRIITLGSAQYGLLAAPPNWDTEVKINLELPTDVSKEPITFTESRRTFAASARYKMSWTSYLPSAAEATDLRIFLTRIRSEGILVPLWPDVCELKSNIVKGATFLPLVDTPARFGTRWIITDEEFSSWEIINIASLNLQTKAIQLSIGVTRAYVAGTVLYPLLLGRLDERPKPEAITDETAEAEFVIKENSAFASRISPASSSIRLVGNNIAAFAAAPLWTVMPNHSRPLDWTEMPDVVYEHVGFLREEQQRVYDHRTHRGQELEFYQNERDSIARIEYFWRDRRATTLRFMVPTFRGDLRITTDTPTPDHPTWIVCEKSFFSNPGREAQPGDGYIALINSDDVVTPHQLSAAIDAGENTRLVSKNNVGAFSAGTTILSHLMLARFSEPTLEWSYTTPYLATTRLKFMELAHEYANPPAPLKEPAYLFIFTEADVRTDLYTSYENTIQIADTGAYRGVYVPAPFSFDTVKTGLKLDEEKLEFKSFKFQGNPLNKMWPFALDAVLTLEIVEVDALHPTSATAISRFYGDIWSVDSDYKATAVPFGNLFDRKFPRFLLSISDNYTQFSESTHLSAAGFRIPGTFVGTPSLEDKNRTSQTVIVNSTTGHAKAAGYFAGGWLETGSGNTKEKRGILYSTPSGTTAVTLTVDRPVLKALANQTLDLYPGYDGSIDQCDIVFHNRINFGGHPYIPNVNPAVKAIKPKQTQGGKKA